jgi:hypothetical protein
MQERKILIILLLRRFVNIVEKEKILKYLNSKKLQELELNFITTKKSGLLGDQYLKTTQQLYLLLKIMQKLAKYT